MRGSQAYPLAKITVYLLTSVIYPLLALLLFAEIQLSVLWIQTVIPILLSVLKKISMSFFINNIILHLWKRKTFFRGVYH